MALSVSRLTLKLFGAPSLSGGVALPTRKTWALLAYLVLEPRAHSRERLAELLWPDAPDARSNLRGALTQLQSSLRPVGVALHADRDQVRLELPEHMRVDTQHFEKALSTTDRSVAEAALLLYTNDLLSELQLERMDEFGHWLETKRQHFVSLLDRLLHNLAELRAQDFEWTAALALVERRIALDPLRESTHAQLIALHIKSGNSDAAFVAYQRCMENLSSIGLRPSSKTEALLRNHHAPHDTPLLGRETLIGEVLSPPQTSWIFSGEPGAGKSSLLAHLRARINPHALQLHGRIFDAGAPFATVVHWLRRELEQGLLLEQRERQALSMIVPSLEPKFASVEHSDLAGVLSDVLFRAVKQSAKTHSAAPLIVADDLHLFDLGSFEVLLRTLQQHAHEGLRLLGAYRLGELSQIAESKLEHFGENNILEISPLEGLGVADIAWLLGQRQHNKDTPSEADAATLNLAQAIVQLTAGNPMFVKETLRAIDKDNDTLAFTGGNRRHRPMQLLRARLARLGKAQQDYLWLVALCDERATPHMATQVFAGQLHHWQETATQLETLGLLGRTGFRHELLREITLEMIPAGSFTLLNARIYETLEKHSLANGNPSLTHMAGVLATHAEHAGKLEACLRYSILAGDVAANVGAYGDANVNYVRVLRLLQQHGEGLYQYVGRGSIWRVLVALGKHYKQLGDWGAGERLGQSLLRLGQQLNDPVMHSIALITQADFLQQPNSNGTNQQADDLLESAWALAERSDPNWQSELAALVGWSLHERNPRRAIELAERGLNLAHTLMQEDLKANHLQLLSNAHWQLGQLHTAQQRAKQAAEIYRSLARRDLEAAVLEHLTLLQLQLGQADAAVISAQQTWDAAHNINHRWIQTKAEHWLAVANLELGAWDKAQEWSARAIGSAQHCGVPTLSAQVLLGGSEIQLRLGRVANAKDLLEQASFMSAQNPALHLQAAAIKAQILMLQNDQPRAETEAFKCLSTDHLVAKHWPITGWLNPWALPVLIAMALGQGPHATQTLVGVQTMLGVQDKPRFAVPHLAAQSLLEPNQERALACIEAALQHCENANLHNERWWLLQLHVAHQERATRLGLVTRAALTSTQQHADHAVRRVAVGLGDANKTRDFLEFAARIAGLMRDHLEGTHAGQTRPGQAHPGQTQTGQA